MPDLDSTIPTADSRRVAAVVYNPIKVDLDNLKVLVATAEQAAGWNRTLWFPTSEEDPGQAATGQAIDAGADLIIAAGGDGTVRAVAERINEADDVALALLPSGTGNLLARNLNLTLDDAEHAIATAFTGTDRSIDLGVIEIRRADQSVDKHAFVVMAGLGLDAKMLANTDDELKSKVGWLAYIKALGLSLRDKNRLRLKYKLDDGPIRSVRANTIIIGNCGSLQANILLMPEAAIDDGRFDILILTPRTIVDWIQVGWKIIWENGVLSRTPLGRKLRSKEVEAVHYQKGERLSMRLNRPESLELDGDEFGETVATRTWVEAGALTVRVPLDGR